MLNPHFMLMQNEVFFITFCWCYNYLLIVFDRPMFNPRGRGYPGMRAPPSRDYGMTASKHYALPLFIFSPFFFLLALFCSFLCLSYVLALRG